MCLATLMNMCKNARIDIDQSEPRDQVHVKTT